MVTHRDISFCLLLPDPRKSHAPFAKKKCKKCKKKIIISISLLFLFSYKWRKVPGINLRNWRDVRDSEQARISQEVEHKERLCVVAWHCNSCRLVEEEEAYITQHDNSRGQRPWLTLLQLYHSPPLQRKHLSYALWTSCASHTYHPNYSSHFPSVGRREKRCRWCALSLWQA